MGMPGGYVSITLLFVFMIAAAGCGGGAASDASSSGSASSMGAVTGLVVTPGDGQNTLSWSAVEGAVSYNIYWETSSARRSYRVSDCSGDRIEGITETSYVHTGLTNGMTYTYGVTAVGPDGTEGQCGNGGGSVGATPESTPLPEPELVDITGASAGSGSVTVTWRAPSDSGNPDNELEVYYLYYQQGGPATYDSPRIELWRGLEERTVADLTGGVEYCFGITAWRKQTRESRMGGQMCATPSQSSPSPDPSAMVWFPGGTFTMGWDGDIDADNPEHTVTLSGFWIDAKEVTQAQYTAWGGDSGHPGYAFPGANNPAENVDWTHASAYCAAQGKRLPTEAEWEYAARNAGTAAVSAYANGKTAVPVACTDANYNSCLGSTAAVGSYPASSSGLYDMAGNVYEWVGDWYDAGYYANGQVNPTGPGAGTRRVARGGSWYNSVGVLRASFRGYGGPSGRGDLMGFRCASN